MAVYEEGISEGVGILGAGGGGSMSVRYPDSNPRGAILRTETAITGSGWIIGAYLSHDASWASAFNSSHARVSLVVDGGGAIVILEVVGRSSVNAGEPYGGGGCGVGLNVRYESGFTPSRATLWQGTGEFGVLYIPDS